MDSKNKHGGNSSEHFSARSSQAHAPSNQDNKATDNTIASRKMEKPAGATRKIMESDPSERKEDLVQRELRYWQSRLTEEELMRVAGKRDQLLAVLYEKYGYSPEKAKTEMEQGLLNREKDSEH